MSRFPAGSVARTSSVCVPSPSATYDAGVEHAANRAPSSRHSNVEPGSFEPTSKVALEDCVFAAGIVGPMVVVGGVVSIVQV